MPPPLEKVHDLMVGLTAQIFGEIKTLPDKLDSVASDSSGNVPSPIEFKFSGDGLQELAKAIADATP